MNVKLPRLGGLVSLACVLLLAGCGEEPNVWTDNTGMVKGTVTFEGQPVTEGQVNLYDKTRGLGSTADIADGKFQFTSPVPAGSYAVFITPPPPPPPTGDAATMPEPREYPDIPAQYRSASTSGLTAEIKEGENSLTFEMTPKAG